MSNQKDLLVPVAEILFSVNCLDVLYRFGGVFDPYAIWSNLNRNLQHITLFVKF